jgi:hypothetical protein
MPGRISTNPDPQWEKASQHLHPSVITAQYNAANKNVRHADQVAHYKRLCAAIRGIIVNGDHPFALADVAQQAISKGLPVDPHALFATEYMLASEARQICILIPSLSAIHKDARLWLAEKLKRDPDKIEGSIPWNFVCGGTPVNEEEGKQP